MTSEERARAVVDGWMLQAAFSQPAFITDLEARIAAAIREAAAAERESCARDLEHLRDYLPEGPARRQLHHAACTLRLSLPERGGVK
jgi:hypothetical protein